MITHLINRIKLDPIVITTCDLVPDDGVSVQLDDFADDHPYWVSDHLYEFDMRMYIDDRWSIDYKNIKKIGIALPWVHVRGNKCTYINITKCRSISINKDSITYRHEYYRKTFIVNNMIYRLKC